MQLLYTLSLHPPLVCLLCASSSACSFAYAPLLSALLPQKFDLPI